MAKERDEERELLRRETQRLREQVHAMHEQRRSQHGSTRPKRRATATGMSTSGTSLKLVSSPHVAHVTLITAFLSVDSASSSADQQPDDVDSITDQPLDTEPSQEVSSLT